MWKIKLVLLSSSANHVRSLQASNIKFNRPVQGIMSLVKSYGAYAQSKELVNLIAEEQGQHLSVRSKNKFISKKTLIERPKNQWSIF